MRTCVDHRQSSFPCPHQGRFPVISQQQNFQFHSFDDVHIPAALNIFQNNLEAADKCGRRYGWRCAAFRNVSYEYCQYKRVITSREDPLAPYYVPFESPALAVVYVCWRFIPGYNKYCLLLQSFLLQHSRTRNFVTSRWIGQIIQNM